MQQVLALRYLAAEPCLDSTIEQVISGSRYKVPNESFQANSAMSGYTPEQARLGGDAWCSSNSLTASSEPPWLQVTFGMEVNIFIIQTAGFNGYFSDYYVTKFQIHIGDGTEGSLHPLTIPNEPSQPMVFVRTGTHDVENTTLPSVVTTKVLRIMAVGWTPSDQVCLRLEALGCLPSPDPMTTTEPYTEVTPYTTQRTNTIGEISEATSYATQGTPTNGEISEATSNAMQEIDLGSPQSRSRVAIVAGAVGGGMSVLVALLLLILVVEAILIFTRRKRAQAQLAENCEAIPEHMVKNTIYGKERTLPIPSSNVPGCSSKGAFKTDNLLGMPSVPSSMMSNIYESIPAPTTIIHDPIEDLNGTVDRHNKEMHDNPLYDGECEEDFKVEFHLETSCIPPSEISKTYESIAATTSALHETIEDLNGTVDPYSEGMHDNPIYDKGSEDDFKMDCDLARSSTPSSVTLST